MSPAPGARGQGLVVPREAVAISRILGALRHPIRLMMVCELLDGERCAGDLTERYGTTKGNISQHLTALIGQKIVLRERRANRNYYHIADSRIESVIRLLKKQYCPSGPTLPASAAPKSRLRAPKTRL
ncbi:MAG: winged helix-turn-helix transcriptional regulator [Spirochaetes bacterium]|nr:winged helix-turn-helix transcriptional regulator [Spirochaetota bacterium]